MMVELTLSVISRVDPSHLFLGHSDAAVGPALCRQHLWNGDSGRIFCLWFCWFSVDKQHVRLVFIFSVNARLGFEREVFHRKGLQGGNPTLRAVCAEATATAPTAAPPVFLSVQQWVFRSFNQSCHRRPTGLGPFVPEE